MQRYVVKSAQRRPSLLLHLEPKTGKGAPSHQDDVVWFTISLFTLIPFPRIRQSTLHQSFVGIKGIQAIYVPSANRLAVKVDFWRPEERAGAR